MPNDQRAEGAADAPRSAGAILLGRLACFWPKRATRRAGPDTPDTAVKHVVFREGMTKKGGMNRDPDPSYRPPPPQSFRVPQRQKSMANDQHAESAADASRLKLLDCPFCGKAPIVIASGERGRGLMIECVTASCVRPHVSYYDHASAVRAWNRRAA